VRRALGVLLAGALASLVLAAPAQAITYSYCNTSLRGGGSLAPDNDIRREWDRLQALGYDLTSSYATDWFGGNGSRTVGAHWIFWRRNGSYFTGLFGCSDFRSSGGRYDDYNALTGV
jgi:hypothetical protein